MKNYKSNFNYKFLIISLFFIVSVHGQELSVGSDIVSRYIWRGFDLGAGSPSIQPNIAFSASGFEAGFWAALPTSDPNALEEIDFYASYTFNLNNSSGISIGFTDYMNPNNGTRIGNFNNYDDPNGSGAHFLEANLNYFGPENFPLSLSFNLFFYNVKNNPIYIQAGYSTSVKDIGFEVFAGATPGEDALYYGEESFSIINTGITISKELKLSENFSLPIFGSVILNPSSENLFYVFGVSL